MYQKSGLSGKKQAFNTCTTLFVQFKHMEPLQSGNGENLPEIQVLRYPALQADFSKDRCPRPTMLTLYHTVW